jgi:hypothetical protein
VISSEYRLDQFYKWLEVAIGRQCMAPYEIRCYMVGTYNMYSRTGLAFTGCRTLSTLEVVSDCYKAHAMLRN